MTEYSKKSNSFFSQQRDYSYRYSVLHARYLIDILNSVEPDSAIYFRWIDKVKILLSLSVFKWRFKKDPWLNYLLVRTRIYDCFYGLAVSTNQALLVNLGCGFERRYMRADFRWSGSCELLYCDRYLQSVVNYTPSKRFESSPCALPRFEEIDLDNSVARSQLFSILCGYCERPRSSCFIFLEGVSPYITQCSMESLFIDIAKLPFDNVSLMFDFKIEGVNNDFGTFDRGGSRFRLPSSLDLVTEYFKDFGFSVDKFHSPRSLEREFGHLRMAESASFFDQDCIVRLTRL